jgi:hypothetical protein
MITIKQMRDDIGNWFINKALNEAQYRMPEHYKYGTASMLHAFEYQYVYHAWKEYTTVDKDEERIFKH